ncbi:hypothetical protein [Embleya sp. NPDC020630]|uniref:hypothetical protein n=1 Tax=Embleya sp. NPDC020630 TaxID=3363979 RepID=UPI00379C2083
MHGLHCFAGRGRRQVGADGEVGGEMHIALTLADLHRGTFVLRRERGKPPFSAAEAALAGRHADSLAGGPNCFVAGRFPRRPARWTVPPGVIIVDGDDRIKSATPIARA